MDEASSDRGEIEIRPVATVAEYRACQDVQRRAWGIVEDGYIVPVATMISVQHAGGLVLGAFAAERLVGFAFGYLGRVEGQWALYSQLAGVDPAVQGRGVGERLKHAQRAWTREQGLALVAWSFDPLQAANANLNLHRLGATARTYLVNYFGERSDALNAGAETDRLLVTWPADDGEHQFVREEEPALPLLAGAIRADGLLVPSETLTPLDDDAWSPALSIEIPSALGALRAADPQLAGRWQEAVRAAFLRAFAAGYVAHDFQRDDAEGRPRTRYLLHRPAEAGP